MKGFICYCEKRKIFVAVLFLVAFFATFILYRSGIEKNKAFIVEDDRIVGITGEAANQGVSISVAANRQGVLLEKEIMLKRKNNSEEYKKKEYELSPEDQMETEITRMTRSINRSQGDVIDLPDYLGEDMKLEWKRTDSIYNWILPLIFPPLLLIFMYRGEKDSIKQKEKNEVERVVMELPSFNNKLVLLLGSGLVYEESIRRIAAGGEGINNAILPGKLKDVVREAETTNGDATKLLNEYARRMKISELKRVTNIIMDNQRKGADLRSKLALEGELLWDRRKKKAEEVGRIAESKLTLPLGIMLIALLIVTAGPAIMQM